MATKTNKPAAEVKNLRLVETAWGVEIMRRVKDNDPASDFKQTGAAVGLTIQNFLGRELKIWELAQYRARGFVETNHP